MKTFLICLAVAAVVWSINYMMCQRKIRRIKILNIIQNLDRNLQHNTIAPSVNSAENTLIIHPKGKHDEVVFAIEHELGYLGLQMQNLNTKTENVWTFKICGSIGDYDCKIFWERFRCTFQIF